MVNIEFRKMYVHKIAKWDEKCWISSVQWQVDIPFLVKICLIFVGSQLSSFASITKSFVDVHLDVKIYWFQLQNYDIPQLQTCTDYSKFWWHVGWIILRIEYCWFHGLYGKLMNSWTQRPLTTVFKFDKMFSVGSVRWFSSCFALHKRCTKCCQNILIYWRWLDDHKFVMIFISAFNLGFMKGRYRSA